MRRIPLIALFALLPFTACAWGTAPPGGEGEGEVEFEGEHEFFWNHIRGLAGIWEGSSTSIAADGSTVVGESLLGVTLVGEDRVQLFGEAYVNGLVATSWLELVLHEGRVSAVSPTPESKELTLHILEAQARQARYELEVRSLSDPGRWALESCSNVLSEDGNELVRTVDVSFDGEYAATNTTTLTRSTASE